MLTEKDMIYTFLLFSLFKPVGPHQCFVTAIMYILYIFYDMYVVFNDLLYQIN